jgi:hypothetical protein
MSGYVFTFAKGAISWKSSKEMLTTSYTMQAEYIACYEATRQSIWLKNFILGLKWLTTYEDHMYYTMIINPWFSM